MSRTVCLVALAFAATHLFFVTLGAAGVRLDDVGPLGRIADRYGILSGAASGYGFFAGGGTGQYLMHFDITKADGSSWTTSLATGSSHEADHRVGHVAGNFAEPDQPLRRKLAASLAAKIFARYPEAQRIVVRIEHFESVSVDAFQSGETPYVVPFYRATFQRKQPQTEVMGHEYCAE